MDTLLSSQISSTPFDGVSDATHAARALHDAEAFTTLYRRYALDVYRYCYRRLRNRESAEDATSQIFINAYAGLPRLGDKPFRPWLFAIAHNVVIDVYRAHRPFFSLDDTFDQAADEPSPEAVTIEWEQRDAVRQLLRQLPQRDREVVELHLAGLTGLEISETLECSREAVRAAQYRAMRRMRAFVQEQGIAEL